MATKEIIYNNHPFEISYDILNPKATQDFIVLHGWGSNKKIMKGAFSSILPEFRHIYIDLPGFGKSTNNIPLHTEDYKNIISLFLDTLNSQKDIIAGHSFGGKVATLLQPKLLVLLSSAGIPVPKPLIIRLKIALFKGMKRLGFGNLRSLFVSGDVSGMSEAMYATFKNVVDEDFTEIFAAYPGNASLFWGDADTATPLSSGEKIYQLIKESCFYPLSGDHFFFTCHAETIGNIIKEEYYANRK